MVPKQDQQRVKSLLINAISLLCRNGLSYKSEFCIEGLLGVTLDNHDIFLINIKETVRNANLSSCSPTNSKDPTLVPLDLMVLNSLEDVPTTIGEDLTMKNTTLTSTPGKKNSSFCPYLDTGPDMCVKGDTSFNFALNYADYDVIEDLSRAGCGKRIQNLTMDDLAVLDNEMGIIMEKDEVPTPPAPEQKCADKISSMKAAGMASDFEPMDQEETLDLSVQDVITTLSENPVQSDVEEGMPLNLSGPKKKKTAKKKFECSSCHRTYKTETSLNKHKCKMQAAAGGTSETTQPLDLTVGRLEEGQLIIVMPDPNTPDSQQTPISATTTTSIPLPLTADTTCAVTTDSVVDNVSVSLVQPIQVTSVTAESEEEAEDSYVCVCSRTLPDYESYVEHMSTCTKAKMTPYKTCEICCKVFFSNSGYVKHKRLHVGAYKLHCHVCQKGFFDSTHLKAHIDARHSKVRRYECDNCDKSFFWKHHLKRHLTSCGGAAQSRSSSDSRASPPDTTETGMEVIVENNNSIQWT